MKKNKRAFSARFDKEAWCETCSTLEPYTLVFKEDGGTNWCLSCAETFDEFDFSDEEIKHLCETEKLEKISYFKRRIKESEDAS